MKRPKVLSTAALGIIAVSAGAAYDKSVPIWTGEVQTTFVIDASPNEIWLHLQTLDSLPEPNEWLFKMGVAYPVRIESKGAGRGSERICHLSTGPMVERITKWEENRVLAFEVLNTPATMKELNPFWKSKPSHLTNYFNCRFGRFELERTGDGRTRVTGTAHYDCRFKPTGYWQLWTSKIVRDVHFRVLTQVKLQAESSSK